MGEQDEHVQQGDSAGPLRGLGDLRLLAALDDMAAAVMVVDLQRVVLYWNNAAAELFGWSAAEALGSSLTDLIIDPAQPRLATPEILEGLARGERFAREYEARHRDGRTIPIATGVSGLVDERGELVAIVGVSLDRTQEKLAEARNRRLAAIIDATPDFVGLSRPDGSVMLINEAGRRLLGLGDDVTSLNVSDFLSPSVMQRLREEIIPHAVKHGTWSGQAMFGWEGREIPVSQVVLAHRDAAGRVKHISTLARDISEQLKTERTLWEREAQASMVAALSQQALAVTELPALFEAAVDGVAQVLGVPLVGVLEGLQDGHSLLLRAGVGMDPEAMNNLVVPSAPGGPTQTAMRTGRPYIISDTGNLDAAQAQWFITTFGGRSGVIARIGTQERPYGVIAVFSQEAGRVGQDAADFIQAVAGVLGNAIERRRTEVDLQRAQRLKALGRFAGGIAHDFNNLLAVMLGNLEVVATQSEDPHIQAAAEQATRAGQQAAALVDQLVSFSRGRERSDSGVDVNAVLRDFEPAVADLAAPGVDTTFELTAGPLQVLADERRLWQAIRHIVVNGLEAMPDSGTLLVQSHYVDAAAAQARGLASQPYVCIVVSDTGPGMDEQTTTHLLEPYFTTKQPSSGRGLGLPFTYGIVTEAGGTLDVTSEPGLGTTVRLWWPAAPQEAVRSTAPQTPVGPEEEASDQTTLLLVEDQAAIRSLLSSVLADRGYTVLEATNGIEALELVGSTSQRIDVVVTDVVMPQMSGPDMVARLREADPGLAVLYVSGFHQDAVEQSEGGAPTAFLRKPFGIAQLVATVADLVDERPATAPQQG